jgi:hypothetical protein
MISMQMRKDINEVLRLIAEKLDLDETRYKDACEKYGAVANWLDQSDSRLSTNHPVIYPQGSFELGTVVKPLSEDEYDIDLVCELSDFTGSPEQIKQVVGDRLKENNLYQPPRLEEKNRCWRLNYAGEFHLDILPARPKSSTSLDDAAIEVPDKDLQGWSDSNPKGYAAWFRSQMAQQFSLRKQILEQKSVDEVPDNTIKTTLQQAIQLLKRNRNVLFEHDNADKPISIIISTLAALGYSNQEDLFFALTDIIRVMPNYIHNIDGVTWIPNPVNKEENFAEKWQEYPQRQTKFFDWLEKLQNAVNELQECADIMEAEPLLVSVFGERVTKSIMKEMSDRNSKGKPTSGGIPPVVNIQGNKPWSN